MLSSLRARIANAIALPKSFARKVVSRDVSQQRSPPTSIYSTSRSSELRHFSPQADILAARRLWSRDGYAAQLVGNVIDFVVGTGVSVTFDSERWQEQLDGWAWNRSNPNDRFPALARSCCRSVIRDGNILHLQIINRRGPYISILNPGWLREGTMGRYGYAGVETDSDGFPIRYHYQPQSGIGSRINQRPAVFPATQILHTFDSEWEDQLVGESWLRRSIDPLNELDQMDALMISSVKRAARTPLVFKIPLEYAYEYVRQIDSQGNPVDEQLSDDPAEREMEMQEAAIRVLRQTMMAGPLDHSIIPNEVDTQFNPYRSAVEMNARFLLLQRAAEGLGISMAAMLGDHGGGRLYSAKYDVAADEKFFDGIQRIIDSHLRMVIDWWMSMMRNIDPSLIAERYSGYEINLPTFPIPDLRSDVIAMRPLYDAHILSPQTWGERYGFDALKELERWQQWIQLGGGNDDRNSASGSA